MIRRRQKSPPDFFLLFCSVMAAHNANQIHRSCNRCFNKGMCLSQFFETVLTPAYFIMILITLYPRPKIMGSLGRLCLIAQNTMLCHRTIVCHIKAALFRAKQPLTNVTVHIVIIISTTDIIRTGTRYRMPSLMRMIRTSISRQNAEAHSSKAENSRKYKR